MSRSNRQASTMSTTWSNVYKISKPPALPTESPHRPPHPRNSSPKQEWTLFHSLLDVLHPRPILILNRPRLLPSTCPRVLKCRRLRLHSLLARGSPQLPPYRMRPPFSLARLWDLHTCQWTSFLSSRVWTMRHRLPCSC
jgi:hypothetical protein